MQKRSWKRKLLLIFISLMILVFLIGLSLWSIKVPPEQELIEFGSSVWYSEDSMYNLQVLKEEYGENKQLPEGLELQALLALSRYPELKTVRINFRLSPALIPIASRPKYISLFEGKNKRIYHVWISTRSWMVPDDVLLENLPFNAQVSMLAHELGHAFYYHRLSSIQMLKFGICYVMNFKYRAIHERSTDKVVIYRGLGKGLLENANYIRSIPEVSDYFNQEGENFLEKLYLSPSEISLLLNQMNR